jgi:hypothetical protein
MQTSRIEEQLSVALSPDSFCSVYWLIPDSPAELPEAIAKVTTSTDTVPWGLLGRWERSSKLQSVVSEIARATHLDGELRIGDTRILGDLLTLSQGESDWFWAEFARPLYPYQIIAESLLAGGIAVTRVGPQLLTPGIALTARSAVIDQIAKDYLEVRQADPIQVERSRFLGGSW